MEGKSPASLNAANLQESVQFDSVLAEWANCLEGADKEEGLTWKRISWTDDMAKLLITAASYFEYTAFSDDYFNGSRTSLFSPKIGKWKVISTALIQRGFKVSPQQCEDKFNDLNRKYKRLNILLGNGMSCKVVENPKLLQMLNLPLDIKEEVCRILTCKQLFYQELCSYHHKNRLFLPHNRELQWQLMMIVRTENWPQCNQELEAAEINDDSNGGKSSKRAKMEFQPANSNDKGKSVLTPVEERELGYEQRMARWLELEEKKLEIEKKKLELEKQRIQWIMFCQKEEWKQEKLRLENEQLKLKNACLAFELKRQGMRANHK